MVQVNPSPQPKLPKSLSEDPFTLAYFSQLEIVIRQLRERTGGNNDVISDEIDDARDGIIARLQARVSDMESQIIELQAEVVVPIQIEQEQAHSEVISLDDVYKRLTDLEEST